MKRQTSLVRVLALGILGVTSVSQAQVEDTSKAVLQEYKSKNIELNSDKKLFNQAIRVIRRAVNRARAKGTPYFVSCEYKIKDDKPVAAVTEVHYSNYRKKPELHSFQIQPLVSQKTVDRTVKFVYKPNLKSLAVVEHPKLGSRGLTTHRIALDI